MKYNLVVAGGGLSGVAAAVSAAREGLKVKSLNIKSVSSAFECINEDDWVEAVNKYLSHPHKGDNL